MRDVCHTSTVLMCLSKESKEEVGLITSSSLSFSLIQEEKASDSVVKRSHHKHVISSWTELEDDRLVRSIWSNILYVEYSGTMVYCTSGWKTCNGH